MNTMNPKVDNYLGQVERWQAELEQLRTIVLDCQLTEELKWGHPCYTFQDSNIVLLGCFKDYCSISFFKGALLKDAQGILKMPGENTQSARLIRFTSVQEIVALEPTLRAYIDEAVAVEKAGLKVDFKKHADYSIPEELQHIMDERPDVKTAFEALTPGRQRAYLMYFSAAKQSKTRTARVEKYIPRMLDGKGINDCVCGHSRRMPACDGSHKNYP